MGKVLFFDIDGNLIPFKKTMPESTKRALKRAKENGHKIVICSGRSRSQIQGPILEVDFDGFVLDSVLTWRMTTELIIFGNTLSV